MIKTIIPQICDINLASSKYILEKYSNYLNILSKFVEQIETSLNYRSTFFKNESVDARIEFFNKLQSYFDKFDSDFVAYWYEIFKSSPDFVKSEINLPSLLLESDSIGKFTNASYLFDDSVCPISDWSMNKAPPPTYVPYNSINKISPWTKQILQRFSFRTNNMYRSNIMLVQPTDSSSLSKKSHGTNLVTDEGYYTRTVSEIKKKTVDKLLTIFKNEIKVLLRYCNINDNEALNYRDYSQNISYVTQYTFKLQVEKVDKEVDILSNKIKYLKSRYFNDSILSTQAVETINLKQKTTEELDRLYKNNLFNRLEELNPRELFASISKTEISENNTTKNVTNDAGVQEEPKTTSNEKIAENVQTSETNLPKSFSHYDGTIAYPAYQAPEWCTSITECIGMGGALDAFNGYEDPLSNFQSASSEDFDLFAELQKINPFNITFTETNGDTLQDLLNLINNIDLSSVSSLFGMNLPLPPFNLGSLFDNPGVAADDRTDALNNLQDSLLTTLENTTKDLLNNVVCGTTQSIIGGNIG